MRDLDQRGERGRDRERQRESESTKGKELTSSKAGLLTLDLLGGFSPLLLVDTRRLGKSVLIKGFAKALCVASWMAASSCCFLRRSSSWRSALPQPLHQNGSQTARKAEACTPTQPPIIRNEVNC